MKKTVTFLMVLGLILSASLPHLLAFSVSYDQKVTVENNTVATIKVVVQDEKMWAQSNFNGMETVVLRNESGAYSYIPAQKMATKIPAAMDRPNLTRDLPHFKEFLEKNNGKKIGTEKINNQETDVYQFTEPTLQRDAKAWLWAEKNFPLKIEVPAPEGLTVVELTNIQFDPQMTSDQFQLPKDVQVIDLENTQQVMEDMAASQDQVEVPADAKDLLENKAKI